MNKTSDDLHTRGPQAATDIRYQSTGALIQAALKELQWQMALTDEITEQRPASDNSFVGKRVMQNRIHNNIEPHRQSAEGSRRTRMSTLRDKLSEMLLACGIEEVSAIRVVFDNGDTILVSSQDDPALDRTDPIQNVKLIQSAKAGAETARLLAGVATKTEAGRRIRATNQKRNKTMSITRYVYWQDEDMWLGYLEEYPDYRTQGETRGELAKNLRDVYNDLTSGSIPCVRRVALLDVA